MDQYLTLYKKLLIKRPLEFSLGLLLLGVLVGWFGTSLMEDDCLECPIVGDCMSSEDRQEEGEEADSEVIREVSIVEPSEFPVDGTEVVESVDLCVDVSGAVVKPGVYCLGGGAILVEAIEKAGGFKVEEYAGRYVAQQINLAVGVSEGMKVYIPYQHEVRCNLRTLGYTEGEVNGVGDVNTAGGVSEGSGSDPNPKCVNINTASVDDLVAIEGIGAVTAESIVDNRPYSSLDDLLNVSGIGESKFNAMKPSLCEL